MHYCVTCYRLTYNVLQLTNKVLQRDVDKEVDGRVKDNEGVGNVVDDRQPFRPRIAALGVQALVGRGDELPGMAENE